LRSVREDHDTLKFQHEVPSWRPVYLRITDVCRWRGQRPQDATPGPAPEHPTPAPSSASGDACSGLNPFAGLYIHTAKLVRGIPIVTPTLQPFIGASSSSSSASSPDRDSSDDYPEIGASACWNSAEDGRLILMVAPNGDRSHNSSSGYPTIERSEASDAQTPSTRLVQNLNLDFNAIQVQAIMETILRMRPDGSPLTLLAQ
jgi:hypothetical protein